jgi:hypothetical protein
MRGHGILVFCAAALVLGGCSRPAGIVVEAEDTFPGPATVVQMADSRLAPLLLAGWHVLEEGSWRWTERRFTVLLKTPPGGQAATLKLEFALPDAVVARFGRLRLDAKVNGTPLPAQSYDRAGQLIYARRVPPEALRGETALVEFELDKALPPGPNDARELGVIVAAVGLY